MKTGIYQLVGAALAMLMSAGPLSAQSEKTIRIGNIQSLSGQYAAYGEEMGARRRIPDQEDQR